MFYYAEVVLAALVQSFMLLHCSLSYMLMLYRTKRTMSYDRDEHASDALLSILVPCYNEGKNIRETLVGIAEGASSSAKSGAMPVEVVICDAECSDDTMEIVREFQTSSKCWLAPLVKLTSSTGGRGPALGAAVEASSGELLLCLHADCVLPADFDQHIRKGLATRGVLLTAFRFAVDRTSISSHVAGLGIMEWTVYLRSRLLQLPFGDQALAVTRSRLAQAGGVSADPIMEDWRLVQSMRARGARGGGYILVLPAAARCSGRRWEKMGVWRTNLVNQLTMLWFSQGATPQQIFDFYYGLKTDDVPVWMVKLTEILRK